MSIDETWIYYCTPESNIHDYYVTLSDKLDERIKKKRPHLKKKKILFHEENAPAHSFIKEMVKLDSLGYKVLPRQPYSLDLALVITNCFLI